MGLPSQLIPTLICLLACTSNFVLGYKVDLALEEIIKTLNMLTEKKWAKNPCLELTIEDVFAAPQNTTEKETFCRTAMVLRQVYKHNTCFNRYLKVLDRNLSRLANMTLCPMNEVKKTTLKDFLESLKTAMKEKYSKS